MYKWQILLLISFSAVAGCNKAPPQAAVAPETARDDDPFAALRSTGESTAKTPDEFGEFDDVAFLESIIGKIEPIPPAPPFDPPPSRAEAGSLLEQCLQLVLSHPGFKSSREFYGTAGDSTVILRNGPYLNWPEDFKPNVDGFDFRFQNTYTQATEGNRVLGIQLGKLDLSAPINKLFDGNISLVMYNAGGSDDGVVIGGCSHFFAVARDGDKFVIHHSGSLDP